MSKKTNAAKHERRRNHYRKPRASKRPNPAYGMKLMSDAGLIRSVETVAFGELGCAFLRALGIKPIDLLNVTEDSNETPEAQG